MKVPNAHLARVDRQKIAGYLLNFTHPDGASKAAFLSNFGFDMIPWPVLADALKMHCRNYPCTNSVESDYGTRYSVDGPLAAPDGRRPMIRTVWIIEKGHVAPRLITAYPIRGRAHDKRA